MENKTPKKQTLTREVFWGGLKVIQQNLAPHQNEVVLLTAFSLISAGTETFIPYFAGRIFDSIIRVASDATLSLAVVGATVAVWYILKLITDISEWWLSNRQSKLGILLYGEYLAGGYGTLLRMPITFHRTGKHGAIGNRIQRAAEWLNNLVGVLVQLAPQFLSILLSLILTFALNWLLASLLVLAVTFYAIILFLSVPPLAHSLSRIHEVWSRAYGHAGDLLQNTSEIKQATAEEFETKRLYKNFISTAGKVWTNVRSIQRKMEMSQKMLVSVAQLTVFVVSIFLVKQHSITPGTLVAFNGYAALLFGPFAFLGHNWSVIQNGLVALAESQKILDKPLENYIPENAMKILTIKKSIEFQNVSFAYEKRKGYVLENISFAMSPGETVAVVGESGVGKTTLVELLVAFHFPTEGAILIDGHDTRTLDLKSYRQKISVVPQEVSLFNDTVEMNIKYGSFEATDKEIQRAAKEAHADEFIETFPKKYKQVVGWRGIKLSTGQKQRIAIARAVLRDPSILILDEPTSALDAKTEENIKESLETLMKGRTTFIIAHRLSTVRRANKILVLEKGKIAEVGTHAELIAREGIYKSLYNLQFRDKVPS